MKYKIPSQLLTHFESEAMKNNQEKDGIIETLAIGVGKVQDDCYQLEELIFPSQKASAVHVEDEGKNLNFYPYPNNT